MIRTLDPVPSVVSVFYESRVFVPIATQGQPFWKVILGNLEHDFIT